MPIRTQLAAALTESMLGGTWSADKLLERAESLFRNPHPRLWLRALVGRVLMTFPATAPRPTQRSLQSYVAATAKIPKVERQPGSTHLRRRFPAWPQTMRAVVGPPSQWPVPPIGTPGDLATWLDITSGELEWFANCSGWNSAIDSGEPAASPRYHYRYRWMPKPSGGFRLLETPKPRLKQLQRKILDGILNHVPPHVAAQAFRTGRSIRSHVAPHAGQDVILHIDLREFFPSIRASQVNAAFRTMGYPERVAKLLTGICTNDTPAGILHMAVPRQLDEGIWQRQRSKHLPQGAPTSPALANLCCYRLDCRLEGLARTLSARYTRYADDLVFSGGPELRKSLPRLRVLINAIVLDEGFEIRHRKTHVMPAGTRQQVSGIRLNVHPNIPRETFDELKAILHNCCRFGPDSQNRKGHPAFREHLEGRLAYWSSVNPDRIMKLQQTFDRIVWPDKH